MTIPNLFAVMLLAFVIFFLGMARDHLKSGRQACAAICAGFGVVMILLMAGVALAP